MLLLKTKKYCKDRLFYVRILVLRELENIIILDILNIVTNEKWRKNETTY